MRSSLLIRIHSFVDIITNSSTEIFVQANEETIKNIKALINNILTIGGSALRCDDIFIMTLKSEKYSPYSDYDDDEELDEDYEDDYTWTNYLIETKPLIDSKEAELASKIIDNLSNLFEGEERSTG